MRLPALWIAAEGSFGVTDEPITSCSSTALHNGFFSGLRFFDAAGDSWAVAEAVVQRRPGVIDRVLNRKLTVELRLSGPERVPLSEIAGLLCACVDRDPGDLYTQHVDGEELKALFRSAQSLQQLLHQARTLGADRAGTGGDVGRR